MNSLSLDPDREKESAAKRRGREEGKGAREKEGISGEGERNFKERMKRSPVMGSRDLFKVPRSSDN